MLTTRRSFLLGAAAPLAASEPRPLFDGVTTKGWQGVNGSEFPSHCWVVAAGCLKAVAMKAGFEDIRTADEFEDFELEFEWKISRAGNSGVKYLIYRENRWKPRGSEEMRGHGLGFEFQVADDDAEPDAKAREESRTGAMYQYRAPSQRPARAVGEFNSARIVRRGMLIEHWINGVRVVDVRLDSEEIRARMRARKVPLELPKRSPIVLQHHSSEAWFRNLRIRA